MLSKCTYVYKTYKHRLVILLVKNTYKKILLFKRRILNEINKNFEKIQYYKFHTRTKSIQSLKKIKKIINK